VRPIAPEPSAGLCNHQSFEGKRDAGRWVCATVADGLWLAAAIGGLALGFAVFRRSVQRNLRELDGMRAHTNELYRIRDSKSAQAYYRGPEYAYNERLRDPALDGSPAWGLPDAMPTTRVSFPSLD